MERTTKTETAEVHLPLNQDNMKGKRYKKKQMIRIVNEVKSGSSVLEYAASMMFARNRSITGSQNMQGSVQSTQT